MSFLEIFMILWCIVLNGAVIFLFYVISINTKRSNTNFLEVVKALRILKDLHEDDVSNKNS